MSDAGNQPSAEAAPRGTSVHEAAEGLFNDLATDPEFADTDASEQPTEVEDDLDIEEQDILDEDLDGEAEIEADEDDEFDDESEDGEEAEENGEDLYEVTLPGGEKAEVTLEELRNGYSRTEDYTRKRQADAETHRQAMSELGEVRNQLDAHLAMVQDTLRQMGPPEPNQDLRVSNPGEFAAQVAEYNQWVQAMENVTARRDHISQEQQREMEAQRYEVLQQEWNSLMEKSPEWNDEATRVRDLGALRQHGIEHFGFTQQEIDSVMDHRLLLMLKENYELNQKLSGAKQAVEKKKAKASKRLTPGSSTKTGRNARSKRSKRAQAEADQLAAQTGSVRDAARAIELALSMEE